jgi:hypothetical protein
MVGHLSMLWRFNILAAGRRTKALGSFPGNPAMPPCLPLVYYPFPMGMRLI